MPLLTVSNISKFFGAEQVLEDVSFQIERSDYVALIGINGAGKSTLLRILAGLEEPDSGSVACAQGLHVAYLPQDPDFDLSQTLYDVMLETFSQTIAAQTRLEIIEHEMAAGQSSPDLVEEYGHLQAFVEHTGYDYRDRIERVLIGLGLEESTWQMPASALSGGQRTRASLGRTLLRDADLLLLDEPTNHLDIPAVEWLESYLRDLKRAFLIVAHDRYLLDRVTDRTLELSFGKVTSYDAPYGRYLELKAERAERQRLEYDAQQRHIAKTEDFIRRYGAGQRSKEARGRQKQLDRLVRVDRPQENETVKLALKGAKRTGDIVLDIRNLEVGYPDASLVRLPREVVVRRGEKVALVGPNGSGKTTLLRTLIGQHRPLHGTVRWGSKTSFGYYSQTLGQLDPDRTVLEEIQRTRPMGEEEGRGYLGRFLFSGDDAFKRVGVLSGGERSRVALAKLILEEPNVLILDEPTNHLDITSRDALQAVLSDFAGTLLFVSHDRHLIDSLAQELWIIENGELTRYMGGYTSYASGSVHPLDREEHHDRWQTTEAPEVRVQRLAADLEDLAARLSEAGPTAAVGQLAELTERYSKTMEAMREAQYAWVGTIRKALRASSGSPARSDAGRRP